VGFVIVKGHLELLVSLSEGKLVRRPWLRPVVVPYTLDALWRLGRWDELAALLEIETQNSSSNALHDGVTVRRGAPGGVSAEYTQALSGLFSQRFLLMFGPTRFAL